MNQIVIKNVEIRVGKEILFINYSENKQETPLFNVFIDKLMNYSYFSKLKDVNKVKAKKDNNDNISLLPFEFRNEHIIALCIACQELLMTQSNMPKVNSPIKIFGDLHGQFEDLLKFFQFFKEPSEAINGDINYCDYLFLGDYVDRGSYSLEVICLLFALKLKYPEKIWLLRGNHEDPTINMNFGFHQECMMRLKKDGNEHKVYNAINSVFCWLPLAALIDNDILCLHGGLGQSVKDLQVIEELKRPITVVHEANTKIEQLIMDILWSDPTETDSIKGIKPNQVRDASKYGNIVKFGPDIVENFLNKNKLSMLIRAHECVMDGFERFSKGNLITVFSATDYCRKHKNAGAILLINSKKEIIPMIIYPQNNIDNIRWIESEEDYLKRPPTPVKTKK